MSEPSTELPKKRNTRTTVIIAVVAALVVAGVAVFFLTRGDDPAAAPSGQNGGPAAGGSTPASPPPPPTGAAAAEVGNARKVAEEAIQAFNSHDAQAYKKISCDPQTTGPADNAPAEARVELVSNPELTGDSGTVELKLILGDQSTSLPLPLRKLNGTWCVD